MPNTVIYNPLLKKGFQDIADTGSIETDVAQLQTDVAELQQHKITKCLTAAELDDVTEGEIFEWQGADTSDPAELVNGYFYKKHFLPATQQVLILYRPYDYIGGSYLADTYYYQNSENPNLTEHYATRSLDNKDILWISNESAPNIGDIVTVGSFDTDQTFVTIVNREIVDLHFVYTDSNGDTWTIIDTVYGRQITYNYYENQQGVTINVNWNNFFDYMGFVCFDNGKPYLVKWTTYGETGAKFDTVINPEGSATYTQTDTQPRLENIANGSGGVVNITTDTNIAGNLTVSGTTSTVHAQEIQSEADYIELRNGNPLGLANGERSGLEVNNYDGNGTDCILAVDNQGWARVGDKGGTLQKLATIQETPTDGDFVKYNNTTKELESTTDGSALTVTFTTGTDKIRANVESGDTLSKIASIINANFELRAINSSDIEINNDAVNLSNIYGSFMPYFGVIIIQGWFVLKSSVATNDNVFRIKGYLPTACYPAFVAETTVNICKLQGDSSSEWLRFLSRTTADNSIYEGLPTVIILNKNS